MEKSSEFFKKYGHIVSFSFAIATVLFLFLPLLTIKLGDGTKYDVNLITYFTNPNSFNWTIFVFMGLVLVGSICVILVKFKKELGSVASLLFLVAIPLIVLEREFYSYNDISDLSGVKINFGLAIVILSLIIAFVTSVSLSYGLNQMSVKDIAEDGILIAMAFILNFLKISLGSSGGSINFQMLPLFLIALRHGPSHGLIAGGIVYGLLTCLTDGYGFATYPFDYLIGFGSVMVLGFFKDLILPKDAQNYNVKGEIFIAIGCVLGTMVRFIGSTASSMIIYSYELVPAMEYNVLYIAPSGAVAMVALMALYGPIVKLNRHFPVGKSEKSE